MRYQGMVYRPPSEAYSLIVQVTYGCSHNTCAFCSMYKEKRFALRPLEEILEDFRYTLSSLAMPFYAIDLPRGVGKVVLVPDCRGAKGGYRSSVTGEIVDHPLAGMPGAGKGK